MALVTAIAAVFAGGSARSDYPIYCGGHAGRYVALTFDDGPGTTTPQVIRTLRRYPRGRPSSCSAERRRARGPGRQEKALGEVGNHSWSHPDLSKYSAAGVAQQLRARRRRSGALASPPHRLPPAVRGDERNRQRQGEGLRPEDDSLVDRLLRLARLLHREHRAHDVKLVQPGAIVLMHDVIPATARALPRILRIVKARKFTLVTVSELLKRDPPSLAQLKRGISGLLLGLLQQQLRAARLARVPRPCQSRARRSGTCRGRASSAPASRPTRQSRARAHRPHWHPQVRVQRVSRPVDAHERAGLPAVVGHAEADASPSCPSFALAASARAVGARLWCIRLRRERVPARRLRRRSPSWSARPPSPRERARPRGLAGAQGSCPPP